MIRHLTPILVAMLSLASLLNTSMSSADELPGIVFHVDSDLRMNRVLRQIERHHRGNPEVPSRVILIAEGVRPAVSGAEDANGGRYSAQIEQLLAQGIRIFACENTLTSFGLTADDLEFGIESVPSGIVELGRLQATAGWGYIKL